MIIVKKDKYDKDMEDIKKYVDSIEEGFKSRNCNCVDEKLIIPTNRNFDEKFKLVVKMTPNKYRRRRQLTLILEEIKNTTGIVSKGNFLPWANRDTFDKEFKKEFKISPAKYIKEGNIKLQEKIDVNSIKEEDMIIDKLSKEHKSYEGALKYLLSLPSYRNDKLIFNFKYSDKEKFIEEIIKSHHTHHRFQKSYKIPKKVYKEQVDLIRKYYDIERHLDMNHISFYNLPPRYFTVKRNLIKKLINKIDADKFLDEILVDDIKTIWHDTVEKEIYNIKQYKREQIYYELSGIGQFSEREIHIIERIIMSECSLEKFYDMESLRKSIIYDFDKKINYKRPDNLTGITYEFLDECNLKKSIMKLMCKGILKL